MSDGSTVQGGRDWWQFAPAEVLKMEFPWTPVGRRGLQPGAVDQFQHWVVATLERAGEESGALRAEIERLHLYIRSQWSRQPAEAALTANGEVALRTGKTPVVASSAVVPVEGSGVLLAWSMNASNWALVSS